MYVLVDYDNIPLKLKNLGVDIVIDSLADSLLNNAVAGDAADRDLRFRLYGGWFNAEGSLSRNAQKLTGKVQGTFPKDREVVRIDGESNERIGRQTIHAEMAYTLLVDRNRQLHSTYRETKETDFRIKCNNPSSVCKQTSCSLQNLHRFFDKKRCPDQACDVSVKDILEKEGQKLVDGMLMSDLIFLNENHEPSIVLASSDDDLWPAIIHVLVRGRSRLYHLRAISNDTHRRSAPAEGYVKGLRTHYYPLTLGAK